MPLNCLLFVFPDGVFTSRSLLSQFLVEQVPLLFLFVIVIFPL
jgi:hypothetical protein